MKIHREGFGIIMVAMAILTAIDGAIYYFLKNWPIIWVPLIIISIVFFYLIVYFFRVPKREVKFENGKVLAPSDGKVVVIEEVHESEYLNEKVRQISIFMSPLNVHCQWYPMNGIVKYFKYHPGSYLVAWHPKSLC